MQQAARVSYITHVALRQARHDDTPRSVLPYCERFLVQREQVVDGLVVDLEVGEAYRAVF